MKNLIIAFTILVFVRPLQAQDPAFEIKLEEEDLVDLTSWVDQDGYILIDASFDTHNHYFYLLNPEGEVVSQYKNFYQNIFYKGFTSNEKEFTVYFSRTPNGEIHFLDFFKEGSRPPLSTVWANAPKDLPEVRFNIEGVMYLLSFDKKKSQLRVSFSDGPVTEFTTYNFDVTKEQAKEILKGSYASVDLDGFFDNHFGAGVATISNRRLILLRNDNVRWVKHDFDLANPNFVFKTIPLPEMGNVIKHKTDASILNDQIFIGSLSEQKACLQITTLDFEVVWSDCFDADTGLKLNSFGILDYEGDKIDDKWLEKENYAVKVLRALASENYGYLNVVQLKNGDYSIKMGTESPPYHTPNPIGGTTYHPAASITFNGNLSKEQGISNSDNFFSQVAKNTDMQFNLPFYGKKKLLALSKEHYFKVDWNFKKQKLDIYKYPTL